MSSQTSDNNKRIAKNTLLLYCRMFVTMLIGFYTSRVVLNSLGVVEYGIYNVVGGIVGALAVLNGAMAGATQRWITIALGNGDIENLKKVFGVGLTAQGIIAILIFLLVESIGVWYLYSHAVIPADRMNAAFVVFQISVITMLLNIMNVPFNGAIMAHEHMGAYAAFSIVDVVTKLLICFVLNVITVDKLIVYALLLFVAFFFNFVLIISYCYKHFIEARLKFRWDKAMYKEMWGLAFWTISGNLAYAGYGSGVTMIVNMFFGPAMNAAQGVAGQASNIINQFSSNFQVALNPQITKKYAQNDLENMHKLMNRSAKFSYYLMLVMAVPMFCEAELLLTLWLGNVPPHAVSFLRLSLFCSMIMAMRNPQVTAAMAYGKLKNYQFVVNGILLMICPVLYCAYKFGAEPEAAQVVFLAFMFLAMVASAYMLQRMINYSFGYFIKEIVIKTIVITILVFIIPAFICHFMDESWFRLFILTPISVFYSLIIIYYVGLDVSERGFVVNVLKKKFISKLKISK